MKKKLIVTASVLMMLMSSSVYAQSNIDANAEIVTVTDTNTEIATVTYSNAIQERETNKGERAYNSFSKVDFGKVNSSYVDSVPASYAYSNIYWTGMDNGQTTITAKDNDINVSFYRMTNILNVASTSDVKIGVTYNIPKGTPKTINLNNFNPSKRYYMKVTSSKSSSGYGYMTGTVKNR